MLDLGLYIAYVLMVAAILSAIGLPLYNAIRAGGGSFRQSLIGIGALVILAVVSYALSGSGVTEHQVALGVTPGMSKLIGCGLITLYVVIVVAIIGLIASEINKALK